MLVDNSDVVDIVFAVVIEAFHIQEAAVSIL